MSGMAVAFRTSRRNLRRSRVRNALVAGMVSLPVIVMVATAIGHSSLEPSTTELLLAELGNAEARVQVVAGSSDHLLQSPNSADAWAPADGISEPGPPSTGPLDTRVPGAESALRLVELPIEAVTPKADLTIQATVGDAWDPLLTGRYTVIDGRTPSSSDEAMLSPSAATRLGLALNDTFTIDDNDVTFVGTLGNAQDVDEQVFLPSGLVDTDTPLATTYWYTDEALTWDAVKEINEHGMLAYSRAVIEHPPGEDPLGDMGQTDGAGAAMVAIAIGGGLIAILLAGSAFAVGLRREQRVLGMFAVTGADRRHVTAISIATGFWLGLLGGLVGLALGVGIAWGIQHSAIFGSPGYWGFHVPWRLLAAALGFAIAVGALSAVIPALAASRRDPLASLRGALRPRRVRTRWVLTGCVAVAVGAVGLVVGRRGLEARVNSPGSFIGGAGPVWPLVITASVFVTFAGVVLILPGVLAAIARLGAHAPLSARLAFRDASRQSMRTVGVVVAISVSVLAVTVTASVATQTAQSDAARYVSSSPAGALLIDLSDWSSDGWRVSASAPAVDAIHAVVPNASTTVLEVLVDAGYDGGTENSAPTGLSALLPEQNKCPADAGGLEMSEVELATDVRCSQWGNYTQTFSPVGHVVVGGADELEVLLGKPASKEAVSALENGGAALLTRAFLDGSSVNIGVWDQAAGNWPGLADSVPASTVTLPAVVNEPAPSPITPFALMISPETASKLGVEPFPSILIATTPGGFTQEQADAVQAALHRSGDLNVTFSRGPEPDINLQFIVILAVVLLVLTIAAAAISIGIARADARNDDSTLMSVGASPGITRFVAMWQALLTVLLAALVGTFLGLAVAWAFSPGTPGAPFAMPTTLILFVLVGLPAIMGVGALAFTRPARVTAYRLAA